MSKQSEAVNKWRKNTKRKLIAAFGGHCAICGYDKCDGVLEFHHVDPSQKDFHWGTINGNIRSWKTITAEMSKCVCLCSNCHKEVHLGVTDVPVTAQRFNESLISAELLYMTPAHDTCPVCGGQKLKARRTCSTACSDKRKIRVVDWSKHDVVELVNIHKTYEAVGEILGVTGAAVARRFKKQTIPQ